MKYALKILKSKTLPTLKNEYLFEIASERFSGTELIRFELETEPTGEAMEKLAFNIARFMRSLKLKGLIKLFATHHSFFSSTTEAKYLVNKHPAFFSDMKNIENSRYFIYVKP